MNRIVSWLSGACAGAGLAYFFDPIVGNRRRALFRDQWIHAMSKACSGADATWRDIRHRAYGTLAEMRGVLHRGEVADDILIARVRSTLGRYVSHPSSIEVASESGWVTVGGPILADEKAGLLSAIRSVRGVRGVEDRLAVHESAENISALQGGRRRTGAPAEWMQANWSPAARLAAGTTGAAMLVRCLRGQGPASPILGALGCGLLLRSLTNLETKRLFGFGKGRRGIDVAKTITIDSPVENVFALLSDPTNYPRFSGMILTTTERGSGHYQKTIKAPSGSTMTLEESITRSIPNELVAWRSDPSSAIQYAGRARFVPLDDRHTQVQVHATYNPPGGMLSHVAGKMIGYDLKSQLDDLLLRAKSYLETGKQPHDAAERAATAMGASPAS